MFRVVGQSKVDSMLVCVRSFFFFVLIFFFLRKNMKLDRLEVGEEIGGIMGIGKNIINMCKKERTTRKISFLLSSTTSGIYTFYVPSHSIILSLGRGRVWALYMFPLGLSIHHLGQS